jgi:hypothetical protein
MIAKTCTGDPAFGLIIRRRVEYTGPGSFMQLAEKGNNEGIKMLLDKREAFPNDIDDLGHTALQVYDGNNSYMKSVQYKLTLLVRGGSWSS